LAAYTPTYYYPCDDYVALEDTRFDWDVFRAEQGILDPEDMDLLEDISTEDVSIDDFGDDEDFGDDGFGEDDFGGSADEQFRAWASWNAVPYQLRFDGPDPDDRRYHLLQYRVHGRDYASVREFVSWLGGGARVWRDGKSGIVQFRTGRRFGADASTAVPAPTTALATTEKKGLVQRVAPGISKFFTRERVQQVRDVVAPPAKVEVREVQRFTGTEMVATAAVTAAALGLGILIGARIRSGS